MTDFNLWTAGMRDRCEALDKRILAENRSPSSRVYTIQREAVALWKEFREEGNRLFPKLSQAEGIVWQQIGAYTQNLYDRATNLVLKFEVPDSADIKEYPSPFEQGMANFGKGIGAAVGGAAGGAIKGVSEGLMPLLLIGGAILIAWAYFKSK